MLYYPGQHLIVTQHKRTIEDTFNRPYLRKAEARPCHFVDVKTKFIQQYRSQEIIMASTTSNAAVVVDVTASTSLPPGKACVLFYWAEWHEGCPPIDAVLQVLASTTGEDKVFFGRVNADDSDTTWTDKYEVTMVPTLVLLSSNDHNVVVEKIEGINEPSQVTVAVQRLINETTTSNSVGGAPAGSIATKATETPSADSQQEILNNRLKRLINSDQVMLFMKGQPTAPKCGFSRQAVEILETEKIPFSSFDILSDNDVRQGLKTYSNWPTYPQIYVNGELVGGLDILKELQEEDGGLATTWNITQQSSGSTLHDKLAKLINRHDVMLFMKGLPSAPQCGFSRQMCALLDDMGIEYDAFNILEDEQVRQGLKEYSKWPTYPQLYVKGELIGGLDICQELAENGELGDMIDSSTTKMNTN